jgi:hypothetical protein
VTSIDVQLSTPWITACWSGEGEEQFPRPRCNSESTRVLRPCRTAADLLGAIQFERHDSLMHSVRSDIASRRSREGPVPNRHAVRWSGRRSRIVWRREKAQAESRCGLCRVLQEAQLPHRRRTRRRTRERTDSKSEHEAKPDRRDDQASTHRADRTTTINRSQQADLGRETG